MLVQRALGDAYREDIDAQVRRFMDYYADHVLDRSHPYPGVTTALAALRDRGVALAVLSNKPAALCRAIIDGLGWSALFVALVGGDSLPTRKPDPAGLLHLRRLADVPASRVLLVGDSPIDLHTAIAAGTGFCGVTWGFSVTALRTAQPACLIDHAAQLLALVTCTTSEP